METASTRSLRRRGTLGGELASRRKEREKTLDETGTTQRTPAKGIEVRSSSRRIMSNSSRNDIAESTKRADELENEGNFAGAIDVLSEAIATSPETPKLYALRGRLHYLLKAYGKAIRDFDTALSMRPTAATTLYFRARAKAFSDDLDGALEDFEGCLNLQPGSADALFEMGMIHEYRENLKEALRLFELARNASAHPNEELDERIASLRQRLA